MKSAKLSIQSLINRIANTPRSTYILLTVLAITLAWIYFWGRDYLASLDEGDPVYRQCDKVYVGKVPFACQPGDLIMVDADVADKYCTDKVFTKSEQGVYCIYNGIRDDRERKTPLFRSGGFEDINR
ncbi:MAG: hypothetical protein HWE10_02335 [Gammaproteobacteria bacterium]|nr:hypothetical protein [Gammaproteobacteria bacterium]